MKQMKLQSFFLLFILHQCLCQQSTQQYSQGSTQQYGQQQSSQQYSSQSPNKVQLEDIERDNLKSTPPQTTVQQSQSQQYLAYPQDQLIYSIQPQQAAIFQTAQQPVASVYAAQPTTTPLASPQQQYFVQPYYSQASPVAQVPQSYPYVDFGNFPLYPALYPYAVPQNGAQVGHVQSNVVGDYFKSLQQSAQLKTPIQSVKSPSAQVPTVSNYLLSNALPNAYYQPVSFTQPQNPQYYAYNSFYQVQNPQKSVYSAGIKSTTPSAPVKGKEDQFVPVNNGNYRYDFATAEQNNYNKVRLSG